MATNSHDRSRASDNRRGRGFRKLLSIPPGVNPVTVRLVVLIGVMATFGVILLAVYAWQERTLNIFAVGALAGIATIAIASVGGFLFGLPRYNPEADRVKAAVPYVASNNLEQVSDWLTKLLIGAGLVQLGHIGRWLGNLINGLATALSGGVEPVPPAAAKVFAGSLLGFNAALGFLFGYIVTTTWYRAVLEHQAETEHALKSSATDT
jgi:hypothetical protein